MESPAPEYAQVVPREDYWLGWILACYQMETGRPYRQVFDAIPYEELAGMFYPLHEAPEEKFVEALNHRLAAAQLPTRLYRQRKICGVSQKQLAEASGVGLRSIQLYEQRQKNINHAAAETLYRLAFARLRGLALDQVDAAFYYAATGETVYPDLPDEEQLTALLGLIPA